uniref:G-protein coupled receptors family 1 profile domain-containing protein n=1 Tax=Biomphalaria glabrata TaxID=6526 RepID=A0A2C9KRU3_BIOGL
MCICVFGIVGNCLNITVFVKQGLRTSVNLSLCAMSLSDLIGLIFQVWHNFCLNPYLELAELPVDFLKVQILTAGCPNIAMTRITGWITVYITAERCLSVLLPLRIKQIVTFRRSVVILLLCYAVNLAFLMPLYSSNYLSWNFYPGLNKTMLGESSRSNEALADLIMNTAHLYLSVIAFCCVVIFTVALVVSLKRKSEWRRRVTSDRDQNEARSSREKKTMGMIIMVAAILIVCYAPGVTITFVEIFNSEFRISSKQANMYNAVWLKEERASDSIDLKVYQVHTFWRERFSRKRRDELMESRAHWWTLVDIRSHKFTNVRKGFNTIDALMTKCGYLVIDSCTHREPKRSVSTSESRLDLPNTYRVELETQV